VAGAIQDWDRGLVIGDTTFGKGSVQTLLPVDAEHHIKLTTAFYYTPSGRCINKPENAIRGKKKETPVDDVEESDAEAVDSAALAKDTTRSVDTTTYRTHSGRIVHGGGGIVPDTVIKPRWYTPTLMTLLSKDIFFKFANVTYPALKKQNLKVDTGFVVNDQTMKNFYAFFDSAKFVPKSYAMIKFDEFKEKAGLIDSLNKDTSELARMEKPKWSEQQLASMRQLAAQFDTLLKEEEMREMRDNEADIKAQIKNALLVREFGQDDPLIYRMALADDDQVQAAVALLRDTKTYSAFLKPKKKAP
jgi:carboxyl-terminal processing protease